MESKENYTDYQSNPISVLVFNISHLARVDISLDGGEPLQARRQGRGPLYQVSAWDWRKFSHGVHDLSVTVVSADGAEKTVSQQFSLNPAEAELLDNGLANFVLRSSFTSLFQTLYWLTLLLNLTVSLGQCSPLSLVEEYRGLALIGRELHSVATPALLCHKEPARASKAPY